MKLHCRRITLLTKLPSAILLTATLPLLSGCLSLFTTKRSLPQPVAPPTVQTATAEELVDRLNAQWGKFQSLTATVTIQASHIKSKEGVATEYPSFRGNLLLRKPEMLRILGKAPVVQTTMFDLASDGTHFTLIVPPKNKAYKGLNASKGKSLNWYENLRPGFLFDSMVVRGLERDDFYSVIAENLTEEGADHKKLFLHPEYHMNIVRRKAGSQELFPVRVIHFHREDLLPYEQDLYDDEGDLETQVIYGPYVDFDGMKYPSVITLKRPQEEYQLVMTIERVTPNPTLTDDQFQVKIPPGSVVQALQ